MQERNLAELRLILQALNARTVSESQALQQAIPLLRGLVSDQELAWLAQEQEGYGVIPEFHEALPEGLPTYRLVYAGELIALADGQEVGALQWPSAASRLVFIASPLDEIEREISEATSEWLSSGADHDIGGPSTQVQSVAIYHVTQALRIVARFRFEFTDLLFRVLGL